MVSLIGCGQKEYCELKIPNPLNYNFSCVYCNQRDLCNSSNNHLQNFLLMIGSLVVVLMATTNNFRKYIE